MHHQPPSKTVPENSIVKASISKQIAEQLRAEFVMYTVIEALIPVTNMVVTVVRERNDIVFLHRQMLEHLKQGNTNELKARMDELLDYLLQKLEQASASSS